MARRGKGVSDFGNKAARLPTLSVYLTRGDSDVWEAHVPAVPRALGLGASMGEAIADAKDAVLKILWKQKFKGSVRLKRAYTKRWEIPHG